MVVCRVVGGKALSRSTVQSLRRGSYKRSTVVSTMGTEVKNIGNTDEGSSWKVSRFRGKAVNIKVSIGPV